MILSFSKIKVVLFASILCWGYLFLFTHTQAEEKLVDVAGGNWFFCSLSDQNKVKCFGSSPSFFPEYKGEEKLKNIAVGAGHACGITEKEKIICWGKEGQKRFKKPVPRRKSFKQLSAHSASHCAIRNDNRVSCFGDDFEGELYPPRRLKAKKVSVGYRSSCAITLKDRIRCWGNTRSRPPRIQATHISVGDYRACAIDRNQKVHCWGKLTDSIDQEKPVYAKDIVVGFRHSCAIQPNDEVYCWGRNHVGQTDVPKGLKAKRVFVSHSYSCALTLEDKLRCWGGEVLGQSRAPLGVAFQEIQAGKDHVCGITKKDKELICWGQNDRGQILYPKNKKIKGLWVEYKTNCASDMSDGLLCWGQGITDEVRDIYKGVKVRTAKMLWSHGCVIDLDDNLKCWLNHEKTKNYPDVRFKSVHIGEYNCGTDLKNRLICWNQEETESLATPGNAVINIKKNYMRTENSIKEYILQYDNVCMIDHEDQVRCWGGDQFRETAVPPKLKAKKLYSISGDQTCAIDFSDQMVCWGGEGLNMTPPAIRNPKKIFSGGRVGCAVQQNDEPICWGRNKYKQLEIPKGLKVKSMAIGEGFTCAIQMDDTLKCWGKPIHPPIMEQVPKEFRSDS